MTCCFIQEGREEACGERLSAGGPEGCKVRSADSQKVRNTRLKNLTGLLDSAEFTRFETTARRLTTLIPDSTRYNEQITVNDKGRRTEPGYQLLKKINER